MDERAASDVNEEVMFGRRRLLQTVTSPKISIGLISDVPIPRNISFNVSVAGVSIGYTVSFNIIVDNTLLEDLKTLEMVIKTIAEERRITPAPVQTSQTSDQFLIVGIVVGVCASVSVAGLVTFVKYKKTHRINNMINEAGTTDIMAVVESGEMVRSQFHITESLIPVRITLSNLIYANNIPHPIKSR